jgi:hypothetical protein
MTSDIPRIIEGDDPFHDQIASAQFIAEEPVPNPEREALIKELYRSVLALAPDMTPQEIRELFMYKFGTFLESMDGWGIFQAKEWVKTLEVKIVETEEEL